MRYDADTLLEETSAADVAEWIDAIADAVEGGYEPTPREERFLASIKQEFEAAEMEEQDELQLTGEQLVALRLLFDKVGQ